MSSPETPDSTEPLSPLPAASAREKFPLSPDEAEQHHADELDDAIPTYGYHSLPVVGLGGSAGSVQALQAFFSHAPVDSGMAFVVILHLAPEHESAMAQILQHTTTMPVTEARENLKVEPDHVYIIPPA